MGLTQSNPEKTENNDLPIGEASEDAIVEVPQTDVHLSRPFIDELQEGLKEEDSERVRTLLAEIHAADVADVLEVLPPARRVKLIELMGDQFHPDVLTEVEGEAQDDLYEHMPNKHIAEAVTELDIDDAVYVIEELEAADREAVMQALDSDDRAAIEENLSYPEDSAGRLMQRELVALPEFWTVGQTIDFLRSDNADIPEDFYDIFVVDPSHRPVGTLPVSRLMRTKRPTTVAEIMETDPYLIDVTMDQEEAAYQFTKYHLISSGVVDENGRLVGVITVDDVVDVIDEEAEEDIFALAGVGEESGLNENFIEITRSRFTWLTVNLGTAILASTIIGLFDATIEQMVALAVLMPIVASMGGNAGTQTMTVAVRAIATKELSSTNAVRVMMRELSAASLNGLILAMISGGVAYVWFGSAMLAAIFSVAMIINIFIAGLSGMAVPMLLHKLDIDPAIASSVFVTTITDVVGFFAFLGLAYAILL